MRPDSMTFAGVEYRPYNRIYWVSRCGKVIRNMEPYTPRPHPQGYLLCGGRHLLHRMVAAAWIRPPEIGEHIHHINHNKADNRAENLEWVSPQKHMREKHPDHVDRFAHSPMSEAGKAKLRALRLGSKMPDETKAKISKAMKEKGIRPPSCLGRKRPKHEIAWMSENNHRSQACIVHGARYKSFTEAGKALGIRPLTLRKRCLSPNFPEYQLA